MAEAKQTLLIADDSRLNVNILVDIFKDDYAVVVAKDGRQALKRVAANHPDLILLDVLMPEMDGYEVCQRLKADAQTQDIPIVFITSLKDKDDESKGLAMGAIDYIKKPLKVPVVKARVRNLMTLRAAMKELATLRRLALDANPITGLPGNNSINQIIGQALRNDEGGCVIYADLDNFGSFNDKYGFARGDAVIQFTSDLFKNALKAHACDDAFIGHTGGDDFVLLVPSDKAKPITDHIIDQFDREISTFYNSDDARAQSIRITDRRGKSLTFPLMSISMAGVDLAVRKFDRFIQVNDVGAQVRKLAKATSGSCFLLDRRVDAEQKD